MPESHDSFLIIVICLLVGQLDDHKDATQFQTRFAL